MFNMSSILFSLTAVQFIMAAVLAAFWMARLRAAGIKEMALAVTVSGVGALIAGIGASNLHYNLIFIGPLGFVVAILLAARAAARLQHKPPRRTLEVAVLAVAVVTDYYFVIHHHYVAGMLITHSLLFFVVTGLAALDLLREERPELQGGCRILGVMFAGFAVLQAIRVVVRPWLVNSTEWHGQIGLLDFGYAFLGMAVSIGWSLGLIWAAYSIAEHQRRAAYDELDRFSAAVAHDLKSPLNAVIGNIEAVNHLSASIDPAQRKQFLDSAHEAALRMNRFINDLLAHARSGRSSPETERVDTNACLQAARDTLHSMLDAVDATITAGPLPPVTANRLQLTRVFQNLLDNAVKYRDQDRPLAVDIAASKRDGMVRIAFADNGLGIAQADQARVFDRFQRAGKQTLVQGDGMGLAECRRIVESYGGTIELSSELGEGSAFTVALPAAGA
jgi:signal transduction histidine kinase